MTKFKAGDTVSMLLGDVEQVREVGVVKKVVAAPGMSMLVLETGHWGWSKNATLLRSSDKPESCGAQGGCVLPAGHNMGKADVPANHVVIDDQAAAIDDLNRQEDRKTPRGTVLADATDLIHGDRNEHYGAPTENFDRIAAIWNIQLANKLRDGEAVSAGDVADLMIAVKLARSVNQPKRDNYVDIAGYAACGWEAREAQ